MHGHTHTLMPMVIGPHGAEGHTHGSNRKGRGRCSDESKRAGHEQGMLQELANREARIGLYAPQAEIEPEGLGGVPDVGCVGMRWTRVRRGGRKRKVLLG